jgi:hypothetical protein
VRVSGRYLAVLAAVAGGLVLAVAALSGVGVPVATPQPTEPGLSISCAGETVPLPSMLASDPCPDAILAVQLAVAPVRLPIERIVITPGPFYCDVIWPGAASIYPCAVPIFPPGQYMHAWASFRGTDEIAAVMLGLDLPDDPGAPGATRPPWSWTLVAVEVPPTGWVMP